MTARLVATPDEAVREIGDGSCVGVGGSINSGHPMALVRALLRARVQDLTVTGLTSGLDLDLLVAGGAASTLSAAYVGAEEILGLPPAIRWAAEEGRLEVWESEEGIHLASLRARALKLPYTTWTGTLGTACIAHPLVEQTVDEATGATYLKVRPMKVDAALFWAEAADEDGNLLLWGPDMGDEWLRNAADVRIVQVERIVPTHVLAKHPDRVVPWSAEILVQAPLSTHPFGSTLLAPDDTWIQAYGKAVTDARKAGDPALLDAFLDRWIRDADELAYLEQVGLARLRELMDLMADDLFIAAMAREIRDGERVFVGTNQVDVALACFLARRTHAPRLMFWASSTAHLDAAQDDQRVGRTTLDPVLVAGRDNTFWQAHAFDDALRAPVVFAGGFQVDSRGNANLAGIGDGEGGWRLRGPGSAGLPSLTALADRFYIMLPNHDPRSFIEEVSAISVLGDPVARRAVGITPDALVAVISPIASFAPSDDGLVLTEVVAGMTEADVQERTGFPLRTNGAVRERAPLTEEEARVLGELRAAAARNRGEA